jgi:hypothetical protein
MQSSPSLADLQRWMRWVLTHPLGANRATEGEQLAGLPERFVEPEARVLTSIAGDPVPGRGVADRLSVYASGYFSRLHEALELEYPRLAEAVGPEEFRELVAAHLLRAPSSSPSLADLGEDLTGTLRACPAGVRWPWLADLAALERATAEVWLSGPSDPCRWKIEEGEEAGSLRLVLSALARLLPVSWDVVDWRAGQAGPARRQGRLVVWRVEASTGVEWLDHAPGEVLAAVCRGEHLGELCELAATLGMSPEDVGTAFGHWAERGWVSRV